MFLLDNVIIILLLGVLLFGIFTSLNIHTFSRSKTTTLYLTIMFFSSFFKLPFKATEIVYENRINFIERANNDKKLTQEHKEYMKRLLSKRHRIFIALYKSGYFSYSERLISLTDWYKNRPFTVKIRIKFLEDEKKKMRSYENKSLNEIKKSLTLSEMH